MVPSSCLVLVLCATAVMRAVTSSSAALSSSVGGEMVIFMMVNFDESNSPRSDQAEPSSSSAGEPSRLNKPFRVKLASSSFARNETVPT